MRVIVLAVGRMKSGAESDLAARYAARAAKAGRQIGLRGLDVIEIRESRAGDPARRMTEESTALANLISADAAVVALDERGDNLGSVAFAAHIGKWMQAGIPALVFLVGGPDGLAPSLRDRATMTLAFGKATWPHQFVRIMLLEQLYRAVTILSAHPYHRP